jgi:ABC-type sugar transport system permease subunit
MSVQHGLSSVTGLHQAANVGRGDRFAAWRWRHRHVLVAYAILSPMLLYFVIFTWIPILVLAVISFTEWNVVQWPPDFVGLKNYVQIFTDSYYHKVFAVTGTISLSVLVINMVVGLSIALLLNEKIRGRGAFRTIWYLPVVISGAVMAQTFAIFLYPGQSGVFNSLIALVGMKPVIWTQSPFWMPIWVILFSVWRGVGTVVIFFLAGLQSIDPILYEAARVDGANRRQSFRNITLPQLAPITLFVFVTQCVGALQIWEAPLVLTFGGPDNSTRTIVYSLYSDAFSNLTMGLASAQSVLLLIVLMALSATNLRVFRVKY